MRSAATHEAPLGVSVLAARAPQRRAIPWLGSDHGKDRAQIPPARARGRSRKTIRIAGRIASFEADLMNTIIAVLNEKVFVKTHAALRVGFKLDHPTAYAVGIELLIPRGIKRIGKIDPFAIAAHFHHLGTTS